MPTVSYDGSFITFTDDEAAAFVAAMEPDGAYLDELINDYALARGGDVLAVWECIQGPRLGKKIKWSPNRIAAHLGISQPRMDEILDETMAAVLPAWNASPQCARWEKTHRCSSSKCSFCRIVPPSSLSQAGPHSAPTRVAQRRNDRATDVCSPSLQ